MLSPDMEQKHGPQIRSTCERFGYQEHWGFVTSGSSGTGVKVILFSPLAWQINARAAVAFLNAWQGDWARALPVYHVGGAMVHARAAVAGTCVHEFTEKWNADRFTRFLAEHRVAWTSLVPTQVVDLVAARVQAPSCLQRVIVGGGALDLAHGEAARHLGWPVVQSYGATESGSQIATALHDEPFNVNRLQVLPHWQAEVNETGCLQLQGAGLHTAVLFLPCQAEPYLQVRPTGEPWTSNDVVKLHADDTTGKQYIMFIRRADRLVKILGELVDCDAVELSLNALRPIECVEAFVVMPIQEERVGHALVACGNDAEALAFVVHEWNKHAPGFARISRTCVLQLPHNEMGKIDRGSLHDILHLLACSHEFHE